MTDSLVLIPARSGSTRVKNKNLRFLGGNPLVAHMIGAAIESGASRVIVSTDSDAIADVARQFGAETPFRRPPELAKAESSSLSAQLHALQWLHDNERWTPDFVAFCPPTSPFIRAATISEMLRMLADEPGANSIATITKPSTHPFSITRIQEDGKLAVGGITIDGKNIRDVERSQDYPEVWEGVSGCRISRSEKFLELLRQAGWDDVTRVEYPNTYDVDNCLPFEIDRFEALDINDEFDWVFAERVYEILCRDI